MSLCLFEYSEINSPTDASAQITKNNSKRTTGYKSEAEIVYRMENMADDGSIYCSTPRCMINPDAMKIKKITNDINVAPISTEKDGVAIVFV